VELTPARRGAPFTGQGRSSALTKNGLSSSSHAGLARLKCSVGGISPCRRAWTALISPATPAAASRCPTFVFTEPRAQKARSRVAIRNALVSARTSMGSPTGVPVPCASTYVMVRGSTPARACASAITSAWPSRLGAVKPTRWAPSLLTAADRMTASTWSPFASASSRRFNATTPTPQPGTVPLASTSNARQWPSGDRMLPSSYQ
jgi:hypothetical protein